MSTLLWIFILTLGSAGGSDIQIKMGSPTEDMCNQARELVMEELYADSAKYTYWYISECTLSTRITTMEVSNE